MSNADMSILIYPPRPVKIGITGRVLGERGALRSPTHRRSAGISPCFYGVDTPTRSELIASNHNVEEIRRFVEADSVGYLSIGSLRKAVAVQADAFRPAAMV